MVNISYISYSDRNIRQLNEKVQMKTIEPNAVEMSKISELFLQFEKRNTNCMHVFYDETLAVLLWIKTVFLCICCSFLNKWMALTWTAIWQSSENEMLGMKLKRCMNECVSQASSLLLRSVCSNLRGALC